MEDNTLQALAENLAHQAVYGEPDPLVKAALDMSSVQSSLSGALENPAVRNALLGAGAGGLMGLATGGEDKKRKALQYALLGGLGAGGLTMGAKMLGDAAAPPPKELRAPIKSKLSPVAKGVGVGLGAAGATAAAGAGAYALRAGRGNLMRSLPRNSVVRQSIRSFEKLPTAGRYGAPIAGAALLYSLLNSGKTSK